MSTPAPMPQHCPTPRELDDLELLLTGGLSPLAAFDEPGSPVTLALPAELADVPEVELVDPEGLPLARATRSDNGALFVTALAAPEYGPFRRLYLTPAQVRDAYAGRSFVPVTDALTDAQLDQLLTAGPVVLLTLVGHGTTDLSPVALLRATLRMAEALPEAAVVAVPLASHGDAETDHALGVQVVTTYAAGDPVLGLVDEGELLPEVVDIVDADQPGPEEQGLVLFFTGLSGSGKSTLARALMDRLLEQGGRTVTSLDGDVVRRHLSAGLSFSKTDRETNIRRIGWVGAEIARHGGVAVCSPIAPFDETRQQVRAMVDEAGGAFFLVHVATPLEECERRDRKGLYAKARRGEIPEFTGNSSPYEEPDDADVRVDTTGRTIDDALGDVIDALAEAGYLDLRSAAVELTPMIEPTPVVEAVETPAANPLAPPPAIEATPVVELVETPAAEALTPPPVVKPAERRRGHVETSAAVSPNRPLEVLFVCTANICRSPAMELLARHLAGPNTPLNFSSAGTHGFTDHAIDRTVGDRLDERGIATDAFRSRPVTRQMIEGADLVVCAETSHRRFVLDEAPPSFRKVFTLGQLAAMLEDREPSDPATLLRDLGTHRGPADPSSDVADPYGRGPEAAEAAVRQIEELLRVVVPGLTPSGRITS